jgi:hypothetical protein
MGWIGWVISLAPKHLPRILVYGAIIIGIMFFLYSAFLKPTNTTNISDGGKVINVYEPPKQSLFSIGCANLEIEASWKKRHGYQLNPAEEKAWAIKGARLNK